MKRHLYISLLSSIGACSFFLSPDKDLYLEASQTRCQDDIDNDSDDKIDCDDEECASFCPKAEICTDAFDNDADGDIDCLDIDCQADPGCRVIEVCDDAIDNDADGLIDCQDTDCSCVGCGDGLIVSGELCPTSFVEMSLSSVDARSIATGDIDNDADIDLVISNRSPGATSLFVLFNDGGGSFSALQLATPGPTHDVLVVDLNNDGSLDLLASLPETDTLLFLQGNGDGTFGAPNELVVPNVDGPEGLHVADLNNDQRLDLLVASSLNNLILALEISVVPFGLTPRTNVSVSNNPTRVSTGFFRAGNNLPDVALTYQDRTEATILFNDLPDFSLSSSDNLSISRPTDLAVGSLNGDTEDDLVLTLGQNSQVLLLASGRLPPLQTINVDPSPTSLCLKDFDNDGDDDIATAHQTGAVDLLLNEAGSLSFFTGVDSAVGSFVDVACADLNGDGASDLVGLSPDSFSVLLFDP